VVYFGAVRANILAASANQLTVTVPVGATFAPITVTVGGLVAFANAPFQPTFPGDGTPISAATFAPRQDLPTPNGPHRTVIADLDGDGKPDLAIASLYSHVVSFFRNTGTNGPLTSATFGPRVDLPALVAASDDPAGFIGADMDSDGKIDLVFADRVNNRIGIYRNLAVAGTLDASSFAPPVFFTTRATSAWRTSMAMAGPILSRATTPTARSRFCATSAPPARSTRIRSRRISTSCPARARTTW
jgi:hypothetical protein